MKLTQALTIDVLYAEAHRRSHGPIPEDCESRWLRWRLLPLEHCPPMVRAICAVLLTTWTGQEWLNPPHHGRELVRPGPDGNDGFQGGYS